MVSTDSTGWLNSALALNGGGEGWARMGKPPAAPREPQDSEPQPQQECLLHLVRLSMAIVAGLPERRIGHVGFVLDGVAVGALEAHSRAHGLDAMVVGFVAGRTGNAGMARVQVFADARPDRKSGMRWALAEQRIQNLASYIETIQK